MTSSTSEGRRGSRSAYGDPVCVQIGGAHDAKPPNCLEDLILAMGSHGGRQDTKRRGLSTSPDG